MVVEKLKRRFLARLKPDSLLWKEDQEGAATGGSPLLQGQPLPTEVAQAANRKGRSIKIPRGETSSRG